MTLKRLEDQNFYEILEVESASSKREIEEAYLLALATYGPESLSVYGILSRDESEVVLQKIKEAYRVLIDEDRRGRYDRALFGRSPSKSAGEAPSALRATASRMLRRAIGGTMPSDSLMEEPPGPQADEPGSRSVTKDDSFDAASVRDAGVEIPEEGTAYEEPFADFDEEAPLPPKRSAPWQRDEVKSRHLRFTSEEGPAERPERGKPAPSPPQQTVAQRPAARGAPSRVAASGGLGEGGTKPLVGQRPVGSKGGEERPSSLAFGFSPASAPQKEEGARAGGGEPSEASFDGAALRRIRIARGIPLEEICQKTKITVTNLRNIEANNYPQLPASVYLRGYLKQYARCLRLDADIVAKHYMENARV